MKYILLSLFFSSIASARVIDGNRVGNGGIVVVCEDEGEEIASIMLKDFYDYSEAGTRQELLPQIPEGDLEQKVEAVFARLKRLDPELERAYRIMTDNFLPHTTFQEKLWTTPDWSPKYDLPTHCRYEQAAIQGALLLKKHGHYQIRQDIWEKMDDDSRAGLIIHEIVYREALNSGRFASLKDINNFVGILASDQIRNFTPEIYKTLMLPQHKRIWRSP